MGGRVELAALFAFGACELRKEIFVDAAQRVFCAISGAAETDIANEIDKLPKALLVETGSREILWQHAFQRLVVSLNGLHRVIDQRADRRLWRIGFQKTPTRLARHPEDLHGAIFIRVFGIGSFGDLRR